MVRGVFDEDAPELTGDVRYWRIGSRKELYNTEVPCPEEPQRDEIVSEGKVILFGNNTVRDISIPMFNMSNMMTRA